MNFNADVSGRFTSTGLPDLPYPGIRPFEEDEWPIFFGREKIIEEILERLSGRRIFNVPSDAGGETTVEERLRGGRLVAVIGASGGGKSSLIKAGLFATLKQKHSRLGVKWQTITMRPGASPMWSLAEAFHGVLSRLPTQPMEDPQIDGVEQIRAVLGRGAGAISELLLEYEFPQDENLLLLVDQFEEIFRYDCAIRCAEVDLFLEQIINVYANPPANLYTVLTMRSEYLGDCARYPRFADALNQSAYLLRRMDDNELSEAILKPAQIFDGEIETPLLERLLRDAQGEHDHLPLLQHALMRLWRSKSSQANADSTCDRVTLGLQDLEVVGGITGALSQHANQIYEGLGYTEERTRALQLATRKMFLALVEVSEHGLLIRRPLRFEELRAETNVPAEDLTEAIEAFRGRGRSFLMPPWPVPVCDPHTVIDVSHEAVVRQWDKIVGSSTDEGWLREEQANIDTWRRLCSRIALFDRDPLRLLNQEEVHEFQAFWERQSPSSSWIKRYTPVEVLASCGVEAYDDSLTAAHILSIAAHNTQTPEQKLEKLRELAGGDISAVEVNAERLLRLSREKLDEERRAEEARARRAKRLKIVLAAAIALIALVVLLKKNELLQTELRNLSSGIIKTDRRYDENAKSQREAVSLAPIEKKKDTYILLGSFTNPNVLDERGRRIRRISHFEVGQRFRARRDTAVRTASPAEEGYVLAQQGGVLETRKLVQLIAEPVPVKDARGVTQYWGKVAMPEGYIDFGTVLFQFAGAELTDPVAISQTRTTAGAIAHGLKVLGFEVPGEERDVRATGLNEIRIYHEDDYGQAKWLSRNLPWIAANYGGVAGLPQAKIVSMRHDISKHGIVELWLDVRAGSR